MSRNGALSKAGRAVLLACLAGRAIADDPARERPWFGGEHHYPYLESGELGEPPEEVAGEGRVWERRLPIWGQEVIDLGYELPLPYGLAGLLMQIEQDLELDNLEVGLHGNPLEPVDFVGFGVGEARHRTVQAKADLWLFPFMNLFVALGHIDGESRVPLSFPGDEALKLLLPDVGRLCDLAPGNPLRPETCDQLFLVTPEPGFTGESLALGANLAMGWRRYFVTVNATYAVSGINLVNEDIRTLTGAARLGVLFPTGRGGSVAVYVGGMYLDVEIDLTGQFILPMGDDAAVGQDLSLEFSIKQRNADPWNALAGVAWDMSERWSLNIEAGFGGSRSHVLSGVTWRF